MNIILEINGIRYKHVPLEDKPYCTTCLLANLCDDMRWIKGACYHLDGEEGVGKFIKE